MERDSTGKNLTYQQIKPQTKKATQKTKNQIPPAPTPAKTSRLLRNF
jgi:hypothetical protein